MKISHKMENSVCVVTPLGNLALGGHTELLKTVTSLLEEDTALQNLLINLESVNSIDSSGIGGIVSILNSLKKRDGKLMLCRVNKKNMDILSMTALDKIINIFETEEEAVKSVG